MTYTIYEPVVRGPLLEVTDLAAAVGAYMAAQPATRRWDVETSFDWPRADAGRLTEGQRSAVRFVTFIEDHLPGYFALYQQHFPLTEDTDPAAFAHNRELYHFIVRWAFEEDTHARVLSRYQLESGMTDEVALRAALAEEGRKKFTMPYDQPVQYFAYALVQEKATQIFYSQLRGAVGDPVLRDVLNRLSRDEARHFVFFADVTSKYLREYGDSMVEPIREVIASFRMPLAETIKGYWRWALRISEVARFDHTDAYSHLTKVIDRAVDVKSERLDELMRFIEQCRTIPA
jgi:acyl-[acyl-carrier-protein] desaturase